MFKRKLEQHKKSTHILEQALALDLYPEIPAWMRLFLDGGSLAPLDTEVWLSLLNNISCRKNITMHKLKSNGFTTDSVQEIFQAGKIPS